MTEHLHIVCYRWGTKYPVEYVNVLRAMVSRHMRTPFTFHCVTDDLTGLAEGIEAHALPVLGVEGIWRKLMTFSGDFLGLAGQHVVSLDLDIVIVGDLSFLTERPEKDFLIGRNWGADGRASGSVYRVKVGSHARLWDDFIADPAAAIDEFHSKDRFTGEQTWLDHHIDEFDFFPEGKVVSFKEHCRAKAIPIFRSKKLGVDLGSLRLGAATPPPETSIVSFHGDPLPPDFLEGAPPNWKDAPFVRKHWHL